MEEWEDHDRKLSKYIRTNTKPHIFYIPAKHNDYTRGLLEKTAEHVEGKFEVLSGINTSVRGCYYTRKAENVEINRGGKSRRALLARNVKQLQKIRLNEDLLLKI